MYIGNVPENPGSGYEYINKRNITALYAIFGNKLIIEKTECTSKIFTFITLILGYTSGLSPFIVRKIIRNIAIEDIDTVFLCNSKMGKLAKVIKKQYPNINIITFFHNIEIQYSSEELKLNNSFKNRLISKAAILNEKLTCRFSDKFIVLNERDRKLLKTFYNINASFELPTTFKDKYDVNHKVTNNDGVFKMLFVGIAFYGNTNGLNWFINEVLPSIDNVRLIIAGKGMDKIYKNTNNIEVHGFVEDLSQLYYNCDIVVLPILEGGGMKTKTAEAMMYGCPIVGTNEAFTGYDVDFNKIGGLANTKEEMKDCIIRLKNDTKRKEESGNYARYIFSEKYSFENTLKVLSENILNKC